MLCVRTESGTVYELLGPEEYRRNGREHRCILWGAVAPSPPKGGLWFMVPVGKAGGGVQVAPVRILPGKVAPGMPLAFLLPDGDELRAVLSTKVVDVEVGRGPQGGQAAVGQEGKVGPLPEDLLKKLTG